MAYSITPVERRWMDRVQALGCICCAKDGRGKIDAEIHHVLKNGRRLGHMYVLPLCMMHHRGGVNNDAYVSRHPWKKEFERRYGTEAELLQEVDEKIAA